MKYIVKFICFLLFICGFFGLALASIKIVQAAILIIQGEGRPGYYLIHSIDTILLSVVVFVLSAGIYKLFAGNENTFKDSLIFSKINSFKSLKVMLWEALLLTLTVWCILSFYFVDEEKMQYEKLVLPFSILLLSLSLKFISKDKE